MPVIQKMTWDSIPGWVSALAIGSDRFRGYSTNCFITYILARSIFLFRVHWLLLLPFMRSKGLRYSALLLGMLVSVSIILSQMTHQSFVKEKAKTEQAKKENSDSKETTPVISVTSLPSPTVIHFSHEAFFLFEIIFGEE